MRSEPRTQDEHGTSTPVFRVRPSLADDDRAGRARLQLVVARAKEGDRHALHHIYERYADNVFSYVRTILHDDHEAEDVTQHVFTNLLTRINSYQERSVPFTAWLLRIARNCAIDHVRSKRAVCYEEVPAVEGPAGGGPASDEVAFDRRDAVEDALRSLPDRQRQVVFLRHVVGLSPREIAAQMGKSEGAVHTLHHRARRALRTELVRRSTVPVAWRRPESPPEEAGLVTA